MKVKDVEKVLPIDVSVEAAGVDDEEEANIEDPAHPMQPQRNQLVEEAIQKFVKRQASNLIKKLRSTGQKSKLARSAYLANLDKADRKRSFITLNPKFPHRHRQALYFFKRRLHNMLTMQKLHQKRNPQGKKGEPKTRYLYQEYYRQVYPDAKCHACVSNKVPNPPAEDTKHAIECENVPGKVQLFEQTWIRIKKMILQKSSDVRKKQNVAYLRPFLAATRAMRGEVPMPPSGPGYDSLWRVWAVSDESREAGLIPAGFLGALIECGVSCRRAPELADEITHIVLDAEYQAFLLRQRQIAQDRNIGRVFREIMSCPRWKQRGEA